MYPVYTKEYLMRTRIAHLLIAALVLMATLLMAACSRGGTGVDGSGKVIAETRPVSGFTAVNLNGFGKLLITQGDTEALTISADDNLLPLITSEVQGDTLVMGPKSDTNINKFKDMTYQLTVKDLRTVKVDGMASVEAQDLAIDSLHVESNGAGGWTLSGSVSDLDVQINGMGSFDSPDLASKTARVVISGGGSVTVQVSDTLDAEINGAGSVHYIGDPKVTKRIIGGGIVSQQ